MENEAKKPETTSAAGGQNEPLVMRNSNVDDELELIIGQQKEDLDSLRDSIKTANQALMEVDHAQNIGPGWYTRGEDGLRQQVRMWVRRGLEATRKHLDT